MGKKVKRLKQLELMIINNQGLCLRNNFSKNTVLKQGLLIRERDLLKQEIGAFN